MPAESKELKLGDRCPNCGGEMKPDPKHDSERLIKNHQAVAHDSRAHETYARSVRTKTEDEGVIYTCGTCGYSARLKDKSANGGRRRGSGNAAGSGAVDRRDETGDDYPNQGRP